MVMQQHNIWCVYVCSIWRGMLDCKYHGKKRQK